MSSLSVLFGVIGLKNTHENLVLRGHCPGGPLVFSDHVMIVNVFVYLLNMVFMRFGLSKQILLPFIK